jgi:hypothetical protein
MQSEFSKGGTNLWPKCHTGFPTFILIALPVFYFVVCFQSLVWRICYYWIACWHLENVCGRLQFHLNNFQRRALRTDRYNNTARGNHHLTTLLPVSAVIVELPGRRLYKILQASIRKWTIYFYRPVMYDYVNCLVTYHDCSPKWYSVVRLPLFLENRQIKNDKTHGWFYLCPNTVTVQHHKDRCLVNENECSINWSCIIVAVVS